MEIYLTFNTQSSQVVIQLYSVFYNVLELFLICVINLSILELVCRMSGLHVWGLVSPFKVAKD